MVFTLTVIFSSHKAIPPSMQVRPNPESLHTRELDSLIPHLEFPLSLYLGLPSCFYHRPHTTGPQGRPLSFAYPAS